MTPKFEHHINHPEFLVDIESDYFHTSNLDFTYEPFDCEHSIRYLGTINEGMEPPTLTRLHYFTNLTGEKLGVVDATVSIAQGKPVHDLKSIRMKEVDYFLREVSSKSAFKFYHDDHFKLLAGLEEIGKYFEEKQKMGPWLKVDRDGPYSYLPDFEKMELIDEILSRFILDTGIITVDIYCGEVEDLIINLKESESLEGDKKEKIKNVLFYHLQEPSLSINFTYP